MRGTRIAGEVKCPECGTALASSSPDTEIMPVPSPGEDLGYLGYCHNYHPLGLRLSTDTVEVMSGYCGHAELHKYLDNMRKKLGASG